MRTMSTRIWKTHTNTIGQLVAVDSDGINYRVHYSTRQGSYYIADEVGEPVSGLYDTREQAESDMAKGLF
jgi:hypothetical protein